MTNFDPTVPHLKLANTPTPLQPLDRLSESLRGPRIWFKRDDLTGTELTGNKVRKLEYVAAAALAEGAQVLITCGGVQSNHCRATALVVARLGLQCHLILRGEPGPALDGNTLLAHLAGAQISFYPAQEYRARLSELFDLWCAHYARLGLKAYCVPTGASDEVGLNGYYAAARELDDDFQRHNLRVDMVCCATGSGGTHAGLALGFAHLGHRFCVRGYAVCDDADYFVARAEQDIDRWYARYQPAAARTLPTIDVNDQFIGAGYGLASDQVLQTMRRIAQLEGIVLDPVYTAKAMLGVISQIERGDLSHCRDLVFVHTGGIFGVMPFRSALS